MIIMVPFALAPRVIFAIRVHLGALVIGEYCPHFLAAATVGANLTHLLNLLIAEAQMLLHTRQATAVTIAGANALTSGQGHG